MTKPATKFNIYEHVTQTIVAQLEAGTVPWRKPWTGAKSGFQMPLRVTGETYRGINVLMLWIAAETCGYASPTWMTYKQAKDLGAQVRKGAKSTTVIKYGTIEDRTAEGEGGDPQTRSYARAYRVFNCDQIEGLAETFYAQADAPRDLGTQGDRALDAWFARLEIPIDTSDEPAAYYTPATDRIHMPPIATFRSTEAYFATLFHEGAHATKHSSRLDRQHAGDAQEQYCREEVVAELAASMICARLGTENNVEQSAAYLSHWIDVMQQDSRAIIRAASMAQAASDWMFDKAGEAPVRLTQPLAA